MKSVVGGGGGEGLIVFFFFFSVHYFSSDALSPSLRILLGAIKAIKLTSCHGNSDFFYH